MRVFGITAVGLLMLFIAGAFVVSTRLADIASWSFSRAVPEATLQLHHLRLIGLHRLVADELVIRNKKSGEELLKMDGGAVVLSFRGLLHLKIDEVRLIQPTLSISPHLTELFSPAAEGKKKTAAQNSSPLPIGLLRLVCEEGMLRVHNMGDQFPELHAKFTFDLHNLTLPPSKEEQSIIFWSISAQGASARKPFLDLDRMEVRFSFDQLAQSQLQRILVQGGRLIIGHQLRALTAHSKPTPSTAPQASQQAGAPLPAWKVGTLNIHRVAVDLEQAGPDASRLHFQLTTRLQNITLGKAADNLGSNLQTVQLSDIALRAPAPSGREVINLKTIFIRFTLENLLREEIEEVVLLYPTIYLSEDLLAYMDSMSARTPDAGNVGKPAPQSPSAVRSSSPTSGWTIRRLRVDFGNLVIGGSASQNVGLPVKFETDIRNIALDNLAALKLDAQLRVPAESYEFKSYQLEFASKSGELKFAYPPEKGASNVVTVLHLSHLRWRQYQLQDPWLGVTFDHQGINGRFGAKAYQGYVIGGFTFLFSAKSPWSGWVGGRKLDLTQLTSVISPENFSMTGPLNLVLQVNAHGPTIDRMKGEFRVGTPGKMRVGKIDNLLKELPRDWPSFKRSAATIALETLRDFEYKKAVGDFWFADSQGVLDLNLSGPSGGRKFKFLLHSHNNKSSYWNSSAALNQ
ncbi:MAG: hypothetical protein C5B47_01440 [Verrucomicrobia bacterium]|nr:MAG: hypothetical protein C5B47_01440 [Verrucomicrobiota bacterium]